MKTCKNHCFFKAKPLSTSAGEGPEASNAIGVSNSIFGKNKNVFSKSEFDDSYTLWASPRRPPWKNGPWNHVNNEVCAQVAISSARDAPMISKCYYLHAFWKKFMQRKKGEKSEIEQNICVLLIKMQFLCRNHINLQSSCEANKSQPQNNNPEGTWFYWGKMSGSL